jgi:hypothetical protein
MTGPLKNTPGSLKNMPGPLKNVPGSLKDMPGPLKNMPGPLKNMYTESRMGEERGVYRVLVGKPEGKRPLDRPRRRWMYNIMMDLQEVGCGYMD